MKLNLAPRLDIQITSALYFSNNGGFNLQPGDVLSGLMIHDKPIDGVRYYYEKDNYVLIPLNCFNILKRY